MRSILLGLLVIGACVAPPDESSLRGPNGKADAPGECTPGTCGGQGIGGCYCDDECESHGDCCANREEVCLGGDGIPEFGDGTPEIATVANAADGLNAPRDLKFNNAIPDQLFIVNQGDNSVSIIHNVGGSDSSITKHSGPGSQHFCAKPSALAFGTTGVFATAQEEDQITQPSTPADFMGPTLWTSELPLFDAGHQSHLDMLHNSPNGAGIAHVQGNGYFVFDGAHESLTFYDFGHDHGPGGADHSDGVVRRYVEGQVSYVPGVPSHMQFHNGLLYVADTGNDRVAVLDPSVGSLGGAISPNYDGTDQRHVIGGSLHTLIDGSANLQAPSGLVIHGGRLFVSDAATGEIVAFDLQGTELGRIDTGPPGIMGLTIGPDGDLYFVNGAEQLVGHVVR